MKKLVLAALALSMASASAACAQPTTANAPPPQHGRHGGGMFGDADANHDGNITRAEWDASRVARFTRDDKNSDGSLSADERPQWGGRGGGGPPPAGAPPAGAPPRGDGEHRGMNPDTNNDGLISRAEYDAQSAAMFSRFDANGDGTISADEMQAMRDRRGGGGGGQ